MNIPFFDLRSQYQSVKPAIDGAIKQVLEEATFVGGLQVGEFSRAFASFCGVKHCIPVASGTDALYICLKMLGVGTGDEVITVANSWISTSDTIGHTGAKPVFVDIEPDYYTIDPAKIKEKITSRTKAIIPVHLYGQAADMDPIRALAEQHGLQLIEDCAQSHLSEYKGRLCGTMGIAGTFSFYPTKNLGAYGDAGCIITNNDKLAEQCRLYANHGGLQQHFFEGINSRLDSLQAAILRAKLPYLRGWNQQRISLSQLYAQQLNDTSLALPKVRPDSQHTFYRYVVRSKKRDALQQHLKTHGIETAIHYPTILPLLPAYQHLGYKPDDFPVAYQYQQEILSLPLYPELQEEQVARVAEVLKGF